jgi:NAD(P)-dependent dehydrogenase (short-subunit alcohol dehydrogenase family)
MKTAFVTGGGRGLGKGFAKYFLDKGFQVFIGVRNPKKVGEDLENNKNLVAVKIDVSDDESIKSAFQEVAKKADHIDYLINNAGLNKDSATNNKKGLVCNLNVLDRASLLKMFNVNSISPMMVIKFFLPLLNSKPSFVVNISSARSSYKDEYPNSNGNYGYRGSKAALNMMTFSSLFDLPQNVKTFAVHPGGVKTDMNPTGEHKPIEQAKRIINITENWKDEFNGKFLRFDGTFYPL